jgi:hypothetical protein
MPLTETPTELPTEPGQSPRDSAPASLNGQPARIVVGRHGELDHHELIHLLDSIEDERARSRFRESLYFSIFIWLALAWIFTYGQKYWYHPHPLKTPEFREQELSRLNLPTAPAPVVRPTPHTAIDTKTMAKLKESAPQPVAPQPAPAASTPPPPPPPPVAVTPQPRIPPPVVADAPTMQPNFGRPTSPGDNIRNALNDAAHSRGGDTGTPRPSRHSGPLNLGGVEVLSDTQNVDFNPYLRRILGDIKRNWDPLIPAEAQSPLFKQGESYIRFTILPDGTIKDASMHLDGSTHDEAINRSCWGAITSEGQFPPLPKDFHGPEFILRIHFLVNRSLPDQ